MTEQEYETLATEIAATIFEQSTQGCDEVIDAHSHMQNCHAAVANTYIDGIDVDEWTNGALSRVS